jgi:hypothetical protein
MSRRSGGIGSTATAPMFFSRRASLRVRTLHVAQSHHGGRGVGAQAAPLTAMDAMPVAGRPPERSRTQPPRGCPAGYSLPSPGHRRASRCHFGQVALASVVGSPADEDDWAALRRALDAVLEQYRLDPVGALAMARLVYDTPELCARRLEKQYGWRPALTQALAKRSNSPQLTMLGPLGPSRRRRTGLPERSPRPLDRVRRPTRPY